MPSEIEEELIIITGPEEEEPKLPLEACTAYLPSTETSCSSEGPAKEEQADMARSEAVAVFRLAEVEEPIEEEEPEQEGDEQTAEFGLSREQPESETSASDEPTLVEETEADVKDETGKSKDISISTGV